MKIFTRQRIISLVLTLLILLGGAIAYTVNSSKKQSTVSDKPIVKELRSVTVGNFPPASVANKIELDGRLTAYEKINLAAEVQGKLLPTGKTIKQGSYFSKGDLLFKVESKDDEYNLKAQRSSLYNLITQVLPDLKFDYPNEYQKWLNYLNDFDVNQNVKALPEITNQKEKYFIGGKNIMSQYFTIKSLEERLTQYNVYAPFSGVFLSVNNYPGSLVSPGAPLAQIMNTSFYELVSPIPMDALKYISVGQKVQLLSEEMGKTFTGTVNRMSKQIDQTTQSIPVYITVRGSGLRDGMYLKGTLSANKIDDVSIIPKSALVGQDQIFVIEKDSVLAKRSLDIVKILGNEVYIKGLSENEKVVTAGVNNLFVGQTVKTKN